MMFLNIATYPTYGDSIIVRNNMLPRGFGFKDLHGALGYGCPVLFVSPGDYLMTKMCLYIEDCVDESIEELVDNGELNSNWLSVVRTGDR